MRNRVNGLSGRGRLLLVGGVALVLLVGVLVWRVAARGSSYEQGLAELPRSSLRITWTDWAAVRGRAGAAPAASATRPQIRGFLSQAYNLDAVSGSAISESTAALQRFYGFSALNTQWEIFGQGRQGQVDVLKLDDSVDMSRIQRALRRLGYTPPPPGLAAGVWVGSVDLVSRTSLALTPIQQNIVVVPDKHLVMMSDGASYASQAASVDQGQLPSVLDVAGVADLAGRVGHPFLAEQWASTYACVDLSMGQADQQDQRVGTQLVAKAGGISPLTGLILAEAPGHPPSRTMRIAMHFDTGEEAQRNLQPRVDLASGEAPGQGGSFRDRFTVTSGVADGQDVLIDVRLRGRQQVLSDLDAGPTLFATC